MRDATGYQQRTYGAGVSRLLTFFLERHRTDTAIDLGCGSGNEVVYMLQQGMRVTALDRQLQERFILDRITEEERGRVSFLQVSFEAMELPRAELITSFFSLPFCDPKAFLRVWDQVYDALVPGGFFVGQLFGDRDGWREDPAVNTFTKAQIDGLLARYEVLKLDEREQDRPSDGKHWHFYNIIARKP